MSRIFEIRWHGRGGQGAKTAALLFDDVSMATGKYFQAFPEYGPERMGAPVQAFNRLSDDPITIHCGIRTPDVVVVLDPTLIDSQNVIDGLKPNGTILVNTKESPQSLRKRLGLKEGRVFTVDASGIAKETLGQNIPNTPMLGALVKATKLVDFDVFLRNVQKKLEYKFRGRPELIDGNIKSIKRAYEEVLEG